MQWVGPRTMHNAWDYSRSFDRPDLGPNAIQSLAFLLWRESR
jgi:hypothetical protein